MGGRNRLVTGGAASEPPSGSVNASKSETDGAVPGATTGMPHAAEQLATHPGEQSDPASSQSPCEQGGIGDSSTSSSTSTTAGGVVSAAPSIATATFSADAAHALSGPAEAVSTATINRPSSQATTRPMPPWLRIAACS